MKLKLILVQKFKPQMKELWNSLSLSGRYLSAKSLRDLTGYQCGDLTTGVIWSVLLMHVRKSTLAFLSLDEDS